jgi:hypothetical protein
MKSRYAYPFLFGIMELIRNGYLMNTGLRIINLPCRDWGRYHIGTQYHKDHQNITSRSELGEFEECRLGLRASQAGVNGLLGTHLSVHRRLTF